MSRATKVKLCAVCLVDGPWRFDEDGNCLGKHDCATPVASPERERDEAIAATGDAHPSALRAAVRIIADAAAMYETFSANTIRIELEIAAIPGPVVGAAFGQACRDGLIRRDGYVPSTKGNTHGHEIKQWRSLIWRARRTS